MTMSRDNSPSTRLRYLMDCPVEGETLPYQSKQAFGDATHGIIAPCRTALIDIGDLLIETPFHGRCNVIRPPALGWFSSCRPTVRAVQVPHLSPNRQVTHRQQAV